MKLKSLVLVVYWLINAATAHAENAEFTYLRTVGIAELNQILSIQRQAFIADKKPALNYKLPAPSIAKNAIELYTVRYVSHIPERNNKRIEATGLIALPVIANRSRAPLISYQHGTVWGKYDVPSYSFQATNPVGYDHSMFSYETRYVAAMYAGNGYALMAADYFGMGGGAQYDEGYFVKGSSQQANYDLYLDVVEFLSENGITPADFFVGGWSQGGLNTTGFLEKLESAGVEVTAAFTAASPNDPFAALSGTMYFPRKIDAPWINTTLALSVFSFEKYYGPADLAESVIRPTYYAGFRSIYERSYGKPENLFLMLAGWGDRPLLDYFKPEYADPSFFAASTFGKLMAGAETYRQLFKTPIRMYYGTTDEAIKEVVAQLGHLYQEVLIGNRNQQTLNQIELREVRGGDHRRTFITAAPLALKWMNGLRTLR